MLRRTLYLTVAAILVTLATSTKAQAWFAYRYGGLGGYGGYGAIGGYGYPYGFYHYGGYGGFGGYRYGYYRRW
jgi:hypothetical protein